LFKSGPKCHFYFIYKFFKQFNHLGLDIMRISFLCTICTIFGNILATNLSAHAQISSDQSFPTPTKVTQVEKNLFEISDGTKAGINLFHSFENFSIPEDNIARFVNNDISVQNVIGRVTGSDSKIFGKIEATGTSPNFNLYIINPKGIYFGPNAKLSIGGSFVSTTSNAIRFGDQGFLETSTLNDPSLLKINPTALFFDQIRPQSITSQSSMMVTTGNSILLVGGNIDLNGGSLIAPNGRIELSSVIGTGLVELNTNTNGRHLSLNIPNAVQRGNVTLTNAALVDVTDKGGGSIAINAQNIELSGGSQLFAGINSPQKNDLPTVADKVIPGAIVLNATNEILIKGSGNDKLPSLIDNSALPLTIGKAGDISITSRSLILENNVAVETDSFGAGDAGNVKIVVLDGLVLSNENSSVNPPFILSGVATSGVGNGGDIDISAGSVSLSGGSAIRSSVLGVGNSGNISVHADDFISIKDSSSKFTTQIRTLVEAGGIGDAGYIDIRARSLSLTGGGELTAAVAGPDQEKGLLGGKGRGGNILINASDSVIISGKGTNGNKFYSGILADSEMGANGPAGNVSITTNSLKISAGAKIKLSNLQGQAGNLFVNANFLTLDKGQIISETGGSIPSMDANINLAISNLLRIENESLISANASANTNGGNIKIDTPILLVLPSTGFNGSDIRASADFGKGGNITINAEGIFGIQQRKAIDGNQTNDIDASSQFGQSGQVQINTTTDPNQGLVELPATVVDPTTLVAQNPCRHASSSEFTRSGRGGLPPSLSQDLSSETTQVSLVEPTNLSATKPEPTTASKSTASPPLSSSQIAPAQGWVYNEKGEVVLVAYNSAVTGPQRLQSNPKGCPVL
jgi:filamentous hemagglutinin family protein